MDSPRLVARAVRYVRALLRQRNVEREMDDEMRYHVEQEIAEHIARGMDPAEARRRALVDFGGIEVHKEAARDASGVRLLQDFVQDARYAVRALLRTPAFTATAVLTPALGIAGTREFGIRLALGASPGRLVASVLARAARLVGVATAIGLAIGVLLGFAARAFLLGVVPFEPAIIGTVPLLFVPADRGALLAKLPLDRLTPPPEYRQQIDSGCGRREKS